MHETISVATPKGDSMNLITDQVQEVIRYQTMTRVPLAPNTISGLINLRGQIVTALDLRLRQMIRQPITQSMVMSSSTHPTISQV